MLWLMLVLQAACAVAGMYVLTRNVLDNLGRLSTPGLALDVWLPLISVTPAMFLAIRVDQTVASPGWFVMGVPIACVLAALGMGWIRTGIHDWAGDSTADLMPPPGSQPNVQVPMGMACSGAGCMLLLLGAANDLTIWIGQSCFAIAAVILWINTPAVPPKSKLESDSGASDPAELRAGAGVALAMGLALAQGACIILAGPKLALYCGTVTLMAAMFSIVAAVRISGTHAALRIGSWAAVYGVLFGLGVKSLSRMIPAVIQALRDPSTTRVTRVAHGFGYLALEAMGLIVAGFLVVLFDQIPRHVRARLGVTLLVLIFAGVAYRVVVLHGR
jgi:hypothetical protein